LYFEMTENFKNALDKMENTEKNIFITGKAGTGKSTLLKYFRDNTKKSVAVIAPTGVAAINIGGQTFHSFFGFLPDVNIESAEETAIAISEKRKKLYRNIDTIIIDEVSMLRADLLDCTDIFLRTVCNKKKPFGGKQMVFFGDLYQLPPVVTSKEKKIFSEIYTSPYFFSAKSFDSLNLEVIELEKIFRQTNEEFVRILNAIRNNTITEDDINFLNTRLEDNVEIKNNDFAVTLTPRNDQATKINLEMLSQLPGKEKIFHGYLFGKFDETNLPTEKKLILKKNAQVMLLNNDTFGRWVNGSIGKIISFHKDDDIIDVQLISGETVEVSPFEWDIFEYKYDENLNCIKSETIGSFIQYPLKLAWAITIHKSQGKTFDRMILDIGKGSFSPGQVYVALSRVRSIEGLVLKKPLKKNHVFMDWAVVRFMTSYRYKKAREVLPIEECRAIIEDAIRNKKRLEIVYLKTSDEKTRRIIRPISAGILEYAGKPFEGLVAFCEKRGENRTFRLDRILEIKEV